MQPREPPLSNVSKIIPTFPASVNRQTFWVGLALATLGAVLFSAKAIVAKLLYRQGVDTVTLIAFRMLFALPFFLAVAVWQRRKVAPLSWPDLARVFGIGLLGYYLSSFLDFLGLQYISVALERLILFLTPSLVLLISVVWLNKTIQRMQLIALLISYLGIVLVFVQDVQGKSEQTGLGSLLVFGAAMAYAGYLLLSANLLERVGALRLVAYAMCASSAACIVQFLCLRPLALLQQPLVVYGLSLANGFFCTVLPVCMTMLAVERIGAVTASQAGMIGPISTLFFGAWILGEPIGVLQLAGTGLVIAGIYLLTRSG